MLKKFFVSNKTTSGIPAVNSLYTPLANRSSLKVRKSPGFTSWWEGSLSLGLDLVCVLSYGLFSSVHPMGFLLDLDLWTEMAIKKKQTLSIMDPPLYLTVTMRSL
ncbi:hypothetical protein GOODEAATRI_012903 [Goodea atripinnis]|uniref:Uncharacterized protein n=1 Tax=Goodea atripinnis TaxID=208336 RepID=A0ABV0PNU0_9TELE